MEGVALRTWTRLGVVLVVAATAACGPGSLEQEVQGAGDPRAVPDAADEAATEEAPDLPAGGGVQDPEPGEEWPSEPTYPPEVLEALERGDWIIDPLQEYRDAAAEPSMPNVWVDKRFLDERGDRPVRIGVSFATAAGADVERIDFLVDGQVVGTRTGEPWEWTLEPASLSPGEYELSARLVDVLGREAMSQPVPLWIPDAQHATDRLADDLAAGTVSVDDYTRYAVYRLFAPDVVPARYRLDFDALEYADALTYELLVALRFWDELRPETQEELEAFLTPQEFPYEEEG